MIDIHQLLSFSVASFLIVLIPGPNMTFLVSCAATQGKKVAIFGLLGSNAALISLAILTGMGLNTILKAIPMVYDIFKIAGALYLFWLAWKNILFTKTDEDSVTAKEIYSSAKAFRTGYFTNVLNPKAAVFYVAILPEFLNPHLGHLVLQGTLLGLVHAVVSFIVNLCIISSVREITRRYSFSSKMAKIKKWGTAAVFTAFGIRILMQKGN